MTIQAPLFCFIWIYCELHMHHTHMHLTFLRWYWLLSLSSGFKLWLVFNSVFTAAIWLFTKSISHFNRFCAFKNLLLPLDAYIWVVRWYVEWICFIVYFLHENQLCSSSCLSFLVYVCKWIPILSVLSGHWRLKIVYLKLDNKI